LKEAFFMNKTVTAIIVIVIVVVAAFAGYAAWTYPRATASVPVSFSAGVDSKTVAFNQPLLDDKVEVQVSIQSGAVLWRAQILNGDQVMWEYTAVQSGQQSYNSGWMSLPSGGYNFTFGTIGFGSLDATATVSSKGGFW
jgi:hypothetical protein